MMDPLVEALEPGVPLTRGDLERAIRHRLTQVLLLEREVRVLRRLMDADPALAEARAERDPPYEAP